MNTTQRYPKVLDSNMFKHSHDTFELNTDTTYLLNIISKLLSENEQLRKQLKVSDAIESDNNTLIDSLTEYIVELERQLELSIEVGERLVKENTNRKASVVRTNLRCDADQRPNNSSMCNRAKRM